MMAADVASRAWAKQQAITLLAEAIEICERIGDRDLLVQARLARASTMIDADAVHGRGRGPGLVDRATPRGATSRSPTSRARGRRSGSPTPQGVVEHSIAAAEIAERLDDLELHGRALAARSEAEAMGGDLPSAVATWDAGRRDLAGRAARRLVRDGSSRPAR